MKNSRKSVYLYVIGLLFFIIVFSYQSVMAQPVLKVTTWGGNYKNTYDMAIKDFEDENNCKVEWVIGETPDFIVRARYGQVDVLTCAFDWSMLGEAEGLFAELDETNIPNMANLYDFANYSKNTIFANIGDFVIAYNSKYVKEAPTSWNDLWNPAYKNKIVLGFFLSTQTLHMVIEQAIQEGGGIDNIEPGLNRLYELHKIGNIITFAGSDSEVQSLLETDEAWLVVTTNGRAKNIMDKKSEIKIARPKEGTAGMITTLNVAKNSKNLDLAMKFVDWALSPKVQLLFAEHNYYSPTVKNVGIPPELENVLLSADEIEKVKILDWDAINPVKDEWAEKWDKMIFN